MTDPHSLYTPIEAEADQKYHPQAESALEAGTQPSPTAQEDALQQDKPRSLTSDALRDLRRNPIFIISAVIIVVLVIMAVFPGLFTSKDPAFCDLNLSRQGPSSDAWFGYDVQGCDVYTRTIYGARASILVGLVTTLAVVLLGGLLGMVAGFYGGLTDSVVSRVTDIFFGIPLLLGGILMLTSFPSDQSTPQLVTISKVSLALAILAWTSLARIMRSTVIQVKQADYVNAARALGADHRLRHDRVRDLHRHRGNALVPRDRPRAAGYLLGGCHQQRVRLRPPVAAHAAVPRAIPVHHRARIHHDG